MSITCRHCNRPVNEERSNSLCSAHWAQQVLGVGPTNFARSPALEWIVDHLDHEGEECLKWPFSCSGGRGRIELDGRNLIAARVMCALKYGDAPSPKYQAAHSCGKGLEGCTNPNHIRWATPKQNNADKKVHGTQFIGSDCYQAKVTDEEVKVIRRLGSEVSHTVLAARFGLSRAAVWKIATGKSWRHV